MTGLLGIATPRDVVILIAGGMLLTPLTGTGPTVGFSRDDRYSTISTTDAGFSLSHSPTGSVSEEVRALQDEIRTRARLTRQQIAQAIGVDRRSLSAWASGETYPTPQRLETLRVLARLVRDIDTQHRGRAQEFLLAVHPGNRNALSAIAEGRLDLAERLVASVDGRPRVNIAQADQRRRPLYSAAADALRNGRLDRPSRSAVCRESDTYEMDLEEAHLFTEDTEVARRRRGYR